MCGIFGYIGIKDNASEIILKGLKGLEYRGYDSWGIAVKINDKISVEKHVGKIGDAKVNLPKSTIGIGHTRWATHGGVTMENAHPHLDCTGEISVLHNGIIENYREIKDELIKKGHKFKSETDTEVMPHLLEEYLKKGKNFTESMRLAFNHCKGLSAFVAINTKSHQIVAAKNGSPLILGIGENEFFIASDASGILPYTRNLIFIKDNEMISLDKNLKLFTLPDGKEIKPKIEVITWNVESSSKENFKHFMLKEINEQPKVIRNIAENYEDQILELAKIIKKSRGTFFIGCGTAYYASLAGMYLFSKIAKKHVNTAPASEFNYLEDFLTKESLIIALSQSGETIDVVEPLSRAKRKGAKIVSIVNALGSTVYRMGDFKLLLGAGPEKAVASTKAYIAKLSILFMLANLIDNNNFKSVKNILLKTADQIEKIVTDGFENKYKNLIKFLSKKENVYIIGRGISYGTALEGALKLKEISYIHAEGLAGGELKHGPLALIEKNSPCIVLAPDDDTYDAIISNAMEIKARGGYIIGISSKKSDVFDEFIEVKETGCSIISQVIPMQLLSYYLALEKNLDPDKPRNLAKSVTVK